LSGLIRCKECNSFMTQSHTNKKQKGKTKRYHYYRCTSTLKKDWSYCSTKQVSTNRLDNYIFQNLERISRDKQYIDSLVFKLNYSASDNCSGLEPSQICPGNAKISPEIFMHTLQQFIKILSKKNGIDKSLWVKEFIKKIEYSKEEIAITFYYRENPEEKIFSGNASGCVRAATGKDKNSCDPRGKPVCKNRNDSFGSMDWLGREDSNQCSTYQIRMSYR
ncbi:MAG: zinc ribbon domain-containing protein, partial [Actinobacteria bacterium]|nr:zinc ribbon domain-containing protein [Actinomycetota bacterium]MCG2789540.1 zinc ribbon domain-containing protein [Actinomycetes bacterium]